jgi:very-short-patch-repair endonuclease
MIVFSSINPDEIDLSRTSSIGVKDLKHFLDYAKRGVKSLGSAVSGSVGDFESPFEIAVARGLQERGWTVHPQIGVSAFRIDIGIVHPEFPGRYLVGVECDGATYHRSATARDRDKVREDILSRLGWNLLRLWSTDFWVDSEGELDRLDGEIKNALDEDKSRGTTS